MTRIRIRVSLFSGFLVLALSACASNAHDRNGFIEGATLWTQSAGEARALRYQAFRMARLVLEKDSLLAKKKKNGALPRAIIADIDETLLDNTPFDVEMIASDKPFPADWEAWAKLAAAAALPGAVEFMSFANQEGVRLFYLTNRPEKEKQLTIENLKKMKFPDVSEETVICRSGGWSKEARRQAIRKNYRVVLLLGDNLGDFAGDFDDKMLPERAAAVEASRDKWGSEYIILPNPMYGDWESSVYGYKHGLSPEEKAKLRWETLKSFKK